MKKAKLISKEFRRKLTIVNKTFYVSIPRFLVESEGLEAGKEYDFMIQIPKKRP